MALPFNQTLSILSAFLLFVASSVIVYSANNDYWITNTFSLKTNDIGELMKQLWPDNRFKKASKTDCEIFSKLAAFFTKSKSKYGKLRLNVNAGLRDFCLHFKLKDFGPMVDTFQPNMHYCRNHTFLYNYGEHRTVHNDPKQKASVRKLDRLIDVVNECSDLFIACLTLSMIATLSAVLKTPMVLTNFRVKKILQGSTFFILLGSAIAGIWCLVLFYMRFHPKGMLDELKLEQQEKLKNEGEDDNPLKKDLDKVLKKILKNLYIQQNYGQPLFIALLGVIIVLVVMFLTVVEYRLLTIQVKPHRTDDYEIEKNLLN